MAAGRKSNGQELCGRALAVLEGDDAGRHVRRDRAGRHGDLSLRAPRRARVPLTCRFGPEENGKARLTGLASSREGEVSPAALFFLETYWLDRAAAAAGPALGPRPISPSSSSTPPRPAAVYALLALGYSLIYGLIGRENLAFGEFCAMGTFAALAGGAAAGPAGAVAAVCRSA
jgi:branched-chain amino acid transport system permease protein